MLRAHWSFLPQIVAAAFCVLLVGCSERKKDATDPEAVKESASTPLPTTAPRVNVKPRLLMVVSGEKKTIGVVVETRDVEGSEILAQEKVVAAWLPNARPGTSVSLYAESKGNQPSLRMKGKVVGGDNEKGLAFIECAELPPPSGPALRDRPDAATLEYFEPAFTAVKDDGIPENQVMTVTPMMVDLQRRIDSILAMAEQRKQAALARVPLQSRGQLAERRAEFFLESESLSHLQALLEQQKYTQRSAAARVVEAPRYARCEFNRQEVEIPDHGRWQSVEAVPPVSGSKGGILVSPDGCFFAAVEKNEMTPPKLVALAGARLDKSSLQRAGLSFEFSTRGQNVTVEAVGQVTPGDWVGVGLVIVPADVVYDQPAEGQPILSEDQQRQASVSQSSIQSKLGYSDDEASDRDAGKDLVNGFQIRLQIDQAQDQPSQRFMGQFFGVKSNREREYTKPFEFTIHPGQPEFASLSSHQFVRLLASESGTNWPVSIVSDDEVLKTEGRIVDALLADEGRLLILKLDRTPFIRFLNPKTAQWVEPVHPNATIETLMGTSGDKLFLLDPERRILEKWNLKTGKKEKAKLVQTSDRPVALAAALSNPAAPLMVGTQSSVVFLDSATFKLKPVGFDAMSDRTLSDDPDALSALKFELGQDRSDYQAEAEADGSLYAYTYNYRESQNSTLRTFRGGYLIGLDDLAIKARAQFTSVRSLGAGGSCWFSSEAAFKGFPSDDISLRPKNSRNGEGSSVVLGDKLSSFWFVLGKTSQSANRYPPSCPVLDLFTDLPTSKMGRTESSASIVDLDELKRAPFLGAEGKMPISRRVFLFALLGKLVTIGDSDHDVHIRKFDSARIFRNKLVNYPSGMALRGSEFVFQAVAASSTSSSLRLVKGPPGATMSSEGVLRWPVPLDYGEEEASFTIEVGEAGDSRQQSFPVRVTGTRVAKVYLAKVPFQFSAEGYSSGRLASSPSGMNAKSLPVPVTRVDLDGPVVGLSACGGGRYMACLLNSPPRLQLVDLVAGKTAVSVPLRVNATKVTGNQGLITLYYPQSQTLETRTIPGLKVVATRRMDRPLRGMVVGSSSTATPLVVVFPNDNGNRIDFLQPQTLAYMGMRLPAESQGRVGFSGSPNDSVALQSLSSGNLIWSPRGYGFSGISIQGSIPAVVEDMSLLRTFGELASKGETERQVAQISSSGSFLGIPWRVLKLKKGDDEPFYFLAVIPSKQPTYAFVITPLDEFGSAFSQVVNSEDSERRLDLARMQIIDETGRMVTLAENRRALFVRPWEPMRWLQQLR